MLEGSSVTRPFVTIFGRYFDDECYHHAYSLDNSLTQIKIAGHQKTSRRPNFSPTHQIASSPPPLFWLAFELGFLGWDAVPVPRTRQSRPEQPSSSACRHASNSPYRRAGGGAERADRPLCSLVAQVTSMRRAVRCKVSRFRRTCPASQLTSCSRTHASPALGRRHLIGNANGQ